MNAVANQMTCASDVPPYLYHTYSWAYLNRDILPFLDRSWVVSAILWGNANRLIRAAVHEYSPGQQVLQAACVYGRFSRILAEQVGVSGRLEIVDVAALQVMNARRKLDDLPQVQLRQADLARSGTVDSGSMDGVCCFFLLHEVPEAVRCSIVDNLLAAVRPGGKIVFVDYHRPHYFHPLKPLMSLVFRWLEPYAEGLFDSEIQSRSAMAHDFEWTRTTYFGGLYQKLVGVRSKAPGRKSEDKPALLSPLESR